MSQDNTIKSQMEELSKPKPGHAGHVVQFIGLVLGVVAGVALIVTCLWWGGVWAILSGSVISSAAFGVGRQTGIGRGYELAKPIGNVSLNEDQWS